MATGTRLRVVILGGGFGGLAAAQNLTSPRIDVTLIDKTNHHLFQPLLYQVATAALSPGDIAQPIRAILRGRDNVRVVMDTITSLDPEHNCIHGELGTYAYDYLILAPGSRHAYFGHPEWEAVAPGLKTVDDALHIRTSLLQTFELADEAVGTPALEGLLNFVVVGGGPTGVEMAGAIAEISLRTMLPDFPRIPRSQIRVLLVEAADRLLGGFDPKLSEHAKQSLTDLGVEVHLQTRVTDITATHITLSGESTRKIPTNNVIWAAGNAASPLLTQLNTALDRQGRVIVDPTCRIAPYPNVFVVGDGAHMDDGTGRPLPAVAQPAMQMGRYVGKELVRLANGDRAFTRPFTYKDLGSMATIGRARAVVEISNIKLGGFLAWVAWAGLHILKLISFRNRLKVLVEWLWYYVSFQPGARLLYDHEQRTLKTSHTTEVHEQS